MQMSIQTNNHEEWVRSFETLNLTFQIAKHLELRGQWGDSGTSKTGGIRL